jgi:dolichyl-phosphate beta-glucosyltransferase
LGDQAKARNTISQIQGFYPKRKNILKLYFKILPNRADITFMTSAKIKLSIVIPAFNEELRLPATLKRIHKYFKDIPNFNFEILVVDDCSTDGTATLAVKTNHTRVIKLPKNEGKGAAVREGVLNALGEYILITDADLAAPIEESKKLFFHINKGMDVVIGSRAAEGGTNDFDLKKPSSKKQKNVTQEEVIWKVQYKRYLMGRVFAFFVQIFTNLNFKDTQCGFKMFRTEAAKIIFSKSKVNGFSFDVEILLIAQKLNYKIKEVAVNWSEQTGSKVSLLRDSFKMFLDLVFIKRNLHKAIPIVASENTHIDKAS